MADEQKPQSAEELLSMAEDIESIARRAPSADTTIRLQDIAAEFRRRAKAKRNVPSSE